MLIERLRDSYRLGDFEEIFEILVSSYGPKKGGVPTESDLCWRPATDAYETEETFVVQMDLAGMDPQSIEVMTDGSSLLVRGIRQDIAVPGKKHFFKMEISVGPFVRRVPIPVQVDLRSAVARYRNGFLYVTFKKGGSRGTGRRQIVVDK
jgi:HSP20 family protein